jgi:4-hydroxy-tetrahydrodipicolinate reductase
MSAASAPQQAGPTAAGAGPVRVAVAGASGRMGRMLIEALASADDCVLTAAFDVADSPSIGQDATAFLGRISGVPITAELRGGLSQAQVLIDFTRPDGTMAHLAACRELGVKAVIGTTGFSDAQKAEIAVYARDVAIVLAPNMSVGVNVVLRLIDMAARSLGEGYDIEIVEAHHRHKIDAPSGTALQMGQVAAAALGSPLISTLTTGQCDARLDRAGTWTLREPTPGMTGRPCNNPKSK